jgi:hypothetical protein
MLVKRKKKKTYPQTTSDAVWACLLHEVAVAVVARNIGRVWVGVDRGLTGWWWR